MKKCDFCAVLHSTVSLLSPKLRKGQMSSITPFKNSLIWGFNCYWACVSPDTSGCVFVWHMHHLVLVAVTWLSHPIACSLLTWKANRRKQHWWSMGPLVNRKCCEVGGSLSMGFPLHTAIYPQPISFCKIILKTLKSDWNHSKEKRMHTWLYF